jgi:predicted DNA-binding protein with PD1-like motif
MILFESRIVRRFVGRLERGEEVVATLRLLCEQERIRAAWIRGCGILEWADLAEWDPRREAWNSPRRVEGLLTLTSLQGNVAIRNGPLWVQLWVSLARERGGIGEAFGGMLAAARVYSLEFSIEAFDDIRLEREEDRATGLSLFKGSRVAGVVARSGNGASPEIRAFEIASEPCTTAPVPAPSVPCAAPGLVRPADAFAATGVAVSWSDVIVASERAESAATPPSPPRRASSRPSAPHLPPPIPRRERESDFLAEPVPQKGDFVDHRQFGVCRVEGEDGDGGLRIRLPSGVRKVIKLDVFEVLPPRHEGERKVFVLRPRRR